MQGRFAAVEELKVGAWRRSAATVFATVAGSREKS